MPDLHHGDLSKQDQRWHGHFPSRLVTSLASSLVALQSSPLSHQLTLYRSNVGGIICSVMMQQLNQKHPDNYLLAMRVIWAPVGLMIIFWMFIPESPWYHARRENKEKALECMRQLYGGVKGYDIEEEYGIIARTIAHERTVLQDKPRYIDIFKGLNRVSASGLF